MSIKKENSPFFTIECPYCGNKLAYPFNDKSQKHCIKCGASIEDIDEYIKVEFFVCKVIFGLVLVSLIINFILTPFK